MIALLEKLLADNALHSYSIDEESVHSHNPIGSPSLLSPMALRASTSSTADQQAALFSFCGGRSLVQGKRVCGHGV